MIGVTMDQKSDGAWYELKTNMSRPKLATVSLIIMVRFMFPKNSIPPVRLSLMMMLLVPRLYPRFGR